MASVETRLTTTEDDGTPSRHTRRSVRPKRRRALHLGSEARPEEKRPWTSWIPVVLFGVIATSFGLTFISVVPPLWGVDEITHFNRAFQVSTGELSERRLGPHSYGGPLPLSLQRLESRVWFDIAHSHKVPRGAHYATLESQKIDTKSTKVDFTEDGPYSAVPYTAPALGIAVARALGLSVGGTVFLARFAGLALYVALVSVAIGLLRDNSATWIVFTVALLPMSLFQASVVSVDSLAIGLSLLLFALVARVWHATLGPATFAALVVVSAALALTKPNYIILGLLPLVLPHRLYRHGRAWLAKILSAVVVLVPLVIWNEVARGTFHAVLVVEQGAGSAARIHYWAQAKGVLLHPLHFLGATFTSAVSTGDWYQQMVGALGWTFFNVPTAVVALCSAGMFWASLPRTRPDHECLPTRETLGEACVFGGAGIVTCLGVVLVLYLGYTYVGANGIAGVQGRYFLPAVAFLLYGFGRVVPIRLTMSERFAASAFGSIAVISLLTSAVLYYQYTY